MTEYQYAPEVEEVVQQVLDSIEDHYDLRHATILCVFRDKAAVSRGKTVLGRARKLAGLTAFLARPDVVGPLFVLEFPGDLWPLMSEEQRVALVDHELCHLEVERADDGSWVGRTRGHDVEEFFAVVERHGLWKADVEKLGRAAAGHLEQPSLLDDPDGDAAPDGEPSAAELVADLEGGSALEQGIAAEIRRQEDEAAEAARPPAFGSPFRVVR